VPLHCAALRGSARIVRALLELGAGPNVFDRHNETPLHLARDKPVIEALLDFGANPNAPNAMGETPVHLAIGRRDVLALVTLVMYNYPASKPLHLDMAEEKCGFTALHMASHGGWVSVCSHGC
jgi:ankyrin repeat protein